MGENKHVRWLGGIIAPSAPPSPATPLRRGTPAASDRKGVTRRIAKVLYPKKTRIFRAPNFIRTRSRQ